MYGVDSALQNNNKFNKNNRDHDSRRNGSVHQIVLNGIAATVIYLRPIGPGDIVRRIPP